MASLENVASARRSESLVDGVFVRVASLRPVSIGGIACGLATCPSADQREIIACRVPKSMVGFMLVGARKSE